MTVKAWFNNNNNSNNSNNSNNNSNKKNNKKHQQHQQQQHSTITTITAPLPPFSSPPPPYSHTLSSSFSSSSFSSSSSSSSSALNLSSHSPLASTAPSTLPSSFLTTNNKSLFRHTVMQQSQQPQQRHSNSNNESTSPTSPRPYTLLVLPTTTSSSSSKSSSSFALASPSPIDNDVFTTMTMTPCKYIPRPPAEFHIRPSTTTTSPSSSPNTPNNNKNSTAIFSNTRSGCSSNLDKALPPTPPKRATTAKTTALLKLKGLKTRLRTHSFSSSTFSFLTSSSQDHQHFVFSPLSSSISNRSSSSTVSTTRESVAQEYARTIKTLWKMVEDEEQAHRLVEASHSLSGCIPTIADISLGTGTGTGRVVNRPPYVGTMTAALRRPSLPLLMTVLPIQEEDETSTISTTSPTRMPFSPRPSSGLQRRHHAVSLAILDKTPLPTTTKRNTFPLMISTMNEMDHTVADLEVSPVGFSDASEEEDSGEDSEEEEERAVVHIAQKISVYRGRSFCWSQPA